MNGPLDGRTALILGADGGIGRAIAHAVAKHAVVGLARTAALDYADRGLRVNAVAPGSIDSGSITAQPDEVRQQIASHAPLGRLGSPDDVAAAVA